MFYTPSCPSMDALRALTGAGVRRPPRRNEDSARPSLYSPTPLALTLAPALQELRFNWGPDPLLGSYEVDLAGCSEPPEDTVAFFGAVDSRPLLFLMSVALLSTRRYHPQAGFFILVPVEHVSAGPCEGWCCQRGTGRNLHGRPTGWPTPP